VRIWRLKREQHRSQDPGWDGARLLADAGISRHRIAYCATSLELAVLEGLVQVRAGGIAGRALSMGGIFAARRRS